MEWLRSAFGALLEAGAVAGAMGWQILWPLILGFALSGIIQAVVRRERVTAFLAGDAPKSLAWATGLGATSSSCSYAAVALARSLFRKGASLTAAMAFEIAATNLVLELGIILALLLGWQFTLAEFIGGPLMVILVAVGFRLWMRGQVLEEARHQADWVWPAPWRDTPGWTCLCRGRARSGPACSRVTDSRR